MVAYQRVYYRGVSRCGLGIGNPVVMGIERSGCPSRTCSFRSARSSSGQTAGETKLCAIRPFRRIYRSRCNPSSRKELRSRRRFRRTTHRIKSSLPQAAVSHVWSFSSASMECDARMDRRDVANSSLVNLGWSPSSVHTLMSYSLSRNLASTSS